MSKQTEQKILQEEKEILAEVRREEREIRSLSRRMELIMFTLSGLIILVAAIFAYWTVSGSRTYVENASIAAPRIDLAPHVAGTLEEVYVHEGDTVPANTTVARVGNELIKTKVAGLVVSVQNNIGKVVNAGQAVVTVVDPSELRVVGSVEEDKGLSDISVGQRAVFTVDAFGSQEFEGVVDEISPTSRQGDVVFSISNKRESQEFDVKVRFNVQQYSQLKNGMSAKLWIYKK